MSLKEKKKVLFTFDYELFLGTRSGSVSRCLIEPTEQIMRMLGQYKFKSIFFVDVTYLLRMKELAIINPRVLDDFDRIRAQIKQMLQRGHYVFPHIHSHWLDAKYLVDDNQWDLSDVSRYRLHLLSPEERKDLFSRSFALLREILDPAKIDYELNGFRAGGWSIQPFADFKVLFEDFGIKYDFTVMRGWSYFSSAQHFDFRTVTSLPETYTFLDDILVPSPGPFREFCISRIKKSGLIGNLLGRVELKVLPGRIRNSLGDGFSTVFAGSGESNLSEKKADEYEWEMASFELLKNQNFRNYLTFLEKNSYLQFISHPKMLSLHNLQNADRFLNEVSEKYFIETDFKKMIDL